MEREVRYCTTEDDVRIAYCVEGEGPALVIPGSISSFSLSQVNQNSESIDRSLGYGRTLIRFDGRGVGLSDREVSELSHRAHVQDLEAVLSALDQPASVFADGLVGPAVIECVARRPELVGKLILYGTCARIADVFARNLVEGIANIAMTNFDMAVQMLTLVNAEEKRDAPDLARLENLHIDLIRRSISAKALSSYLLDGYDSDATEFLDHISVPTLIIHRLDDPLIPFDHGRKLHASIPGARLVSLSGASHQSHVGDWKGIVEAVNGFLDDGAGTLYDASKAGAKPSPLFRTVLFTDLVGHTEMMSRLGDERGRDVLREHERITREVLKSHAGTEVKTMGDGFMASFGSVTKAVECAVALQRAFADREGEPLIVRVGLNAGEPIEEDGDLFGATVILASRIAANADGGEILVADTVRGLCSGKGFLFADRGEFVAKGFEEPVRVYEVSWRG